MNNQPVTLKTIREALELIQNADALSYKLRVQSSVSILKGVCDNNGWKMFRRAPITNKDWEILRVQLGEQRIAIKFRNSTNEIEIV